MQQKNPRLLKMALWNLVPHLPLQSYTHPSLISLIFSQFLEPPSSFLPEGLGVSCPSSGSFFLAVGIDGSFSSFRYHHPRKSSPDHSSKSPVILYRIILDLKNTNIFKLKNKTTDKPPRKRNWENCLQYIRQVNGQPSNCSSNVTF